MLIAEYSYEKDIQVKQEEAMQIGREQGIIQGIEQGIEKGIEQGMFLSGQIFHLIKESPNLTNGQVAEILDCKLEDVRNVRKMLGI